MYGSFRVVLVFIFIVIIVHICQLMRFGKTRDVLYSVFFGKKRDKSVEGKHISISNLRFVPVKTLGRLGGDTTRLTTLFSILMVCIAIFASISISPYFIAAIPALYCMVSSVKSSRGNKTLAFKSNFIYLAGIGVSVSFSILGFSFVFRSGRVTSFPEIFITAAAIYICLLISALVYGYSIVFSMKTRNIAFEDAETEGTVLYLRGFSDDIIRMYNPLKGGHHILYNALWPVAFLDEFLAQMIHSLGVVIAGKDIRVSTGVVLNSEEPVRSKYSGRGLPQQVQLNKAVGDFWKEDIKTLCRRAEAVVYLSGKSEGVKAELEIIRDESALSRALILLPPLSSGETEKRMETIFSVLDEKVNILDIAAYYDLECIPAIFFDLDGSIVLLTNPNRDWAVYVEIIKLFFYKLKTGNVEYL